MTSPLHPAVTVSNIRTFIPITLDIETGHYTSWSELFKIHCKAFQVYEHLQPHVTQTTSSSDKEKEKTTPAESWERLDSIVLQWIYGTISTDLLHTILKPNTTAYDAWSALSNLFQDNKATRTIDLNNRFANTRLEQFTSMSSYCQSMKVIYDQLTNIGATITEEQLVLQILTGLGEAYESIALIIQGQKPLPTFYETRSQLCMAETRKNTQAKQAAQLTGTALTTTTERDRNAPPRQSEFRGDQAERGRGRGGRGRGRGRGRGPSSRGRGGSWNNSVGHQLSSQTSSMPPQWGNPLSYWTGPPQPFNPQSWAPWMVPPCPYPTAPKQNNAGPGLLGPRPAQSYAASYTDSQTPTDINQALYNMSLNLPDQNWTMDTGSQDPDPYPTVQ
ncbi:putative RNA-directed DNA polymerase [Helianthus annuus]|nr:putative RNA-directed DNA polymerase [Helianthus annuus]KAJ0641285.1 putative RNA-directed DNA polymerase [Helianthus annuus]KAJ0645193.1 putative RNA-directed DNA polymerase [Helianthus annuus]